MKIGVVPGTTGEKYAYARAKENALPTSLFIQYASESDLLPALLNHKIDAIARGAVGNEYQASQNNNLMTISKKTYNEGFAFAVDKFNKILLVRLNQAIRDITNNGAITYDAWFKDHAVFSQHVKQIMGEKHFSSEEATAKILPDNNTSSQINEPDLTPIVMV